MRSGLDHPLADGRGLRSQWKASLSWRVTDNRNRDLIDAIGIRQLDNTLIFYIVGDNGTSAEGGMSGLYNEMTYFNGQREAVADILKHYDNLGDATTYPHFAAGWAVAGDSPFAWTKQVPADYGGTRNGLIIHWPKGITAKNEVRSQWHHVIDVAPTILEAAGLPEPKSVNGTVQTPFEGVSMVTPSLTQGPDRHTTQYFETSATAHLQRRLVGSNHHRMPWEFNLAARSKPSVGVV